MSDIADVTMRSVEYALSGLAVRADVRANDIANAETPLYRSKDVSFAHQLAAALGEEDRAGALDRLQGAEVTYSTNAPDAFGNTVDLVGEMAEMTKDNLLTDAMVNSYNYKIGILRTAIRGNPA